MDQSKNIDDSSLEKQETAIIEPSQTKTVLKSGSLWSRIVKKLSFLNVYLLLFVLIVLIAIIITYIGFRNNKKADLSGQVNPQDLTSQSLASLSDNNTQIGDSKQTLTVASNSVFNGKVLFKDGIDVAGTIRVGGALSLPGITVSGTSNFENVLIGNTLTIASDASVNGNLSVLKSLTVSGGASFGGAISAAQLNIEKLTLNQDLILNRHIQTNGPTPNVGGGTATGQGGTTSINGSDTAGTVTVNVGGLPSAGVLAEITFAGIYATEPHVVITPVGSTSGQLNWYITRSNTGFSILTANAPSAATTASFDYHVLE